MGTDTTPITKLGTQFGTILDMLNFPMDGVDIGLELVAF